MLRLFTAVLLCASVVGLSSAGPAPSTCKNPSIRKEWRALGHDGQKAFADAIKVIPLDSDIVLELNVHLRSACRISLITQA